MAKFFEASFGDDEVIVEAATDETADEQNLPDGHFSIGGREYRLRYNTKRLKLYENANKPVMASFIQNGGAFSLAELQGLLAYGMCNEEGVFVNPTKGLEIAEEAIETLGYAGVFTLVAEALERDCGFLFKA